MVSGPHSEPCSSGASNFPSFVYQWNFPLQTELDIVVLRPQSVLHSRTPSFKPDSTTQLNIYSSSLWSVNTNLPYYKINGNIVYHFMVTRFQAVSLLWQTAPKTVIACQGRKIKIQICQLFSNWHHKLTALYNLWFCLEQLVWISFQCNDRNKHSNILVDWIILLQI